MGMDIYAKPGTKVRVVEKGNELVAPFFPNVDELEMGAVYTVASTTVHDWRTDVYLKEFPGLRFNSVCFGAVE